MGPAWNFFFFDWWLSEHRATLLVGVALINVQEQNSFIESIVYGFGAAIGFSLVLVLFAALRERIAVADVPVAFRGAAIGMVTAGLMSLAFLGFTGLVGV